MPAYLKELPKCLCGKPITHQAFSKFGVSLGEWCKTCAKQVVDEANAKDKAKEKKRGEL